MNEKKTKKYTGLTKISENTAYVKPNITATNKLTSEEITKLLENYQEVDIKNLKRGIHTRYFKKNGKSIDFKLGGILLKIDDDYKYVVMMEKGFTWSVQGNSIFYQKMTSNDEIQELEYDNQKNKNDIIELKSYIKSLIKQLQEKEKQEENYKKKITKLLKEIENLKKTK